MQKHIIITGASRGIGFETAKYLTSKNHKVTAVARSEKKLSELKSFSPDLIRTITADLTKKEASGTIIEHLKNSSLSIDGLINNAGLLINKKFLDLSDNDWQKQLDINLLAPVRLVRDLIRYFNDDSHILNISSMGGFQGSAKFPGLTGYSAAKGALSILTECLAAELSDYNISSNCLCLGAVQTEMLENAFPGMQAPVESKEMGAFIGNFLLNNHKFYNGKILPVALSDPE